MAVARDHLRGDRLGRQAQPLAGQPLDLGLASAVRPDGACELADAHAIERVHEPLAIALELEGPAGELRPEGDRLRVDAVRPAGHHRAPVLLRAADDGLLRSVDTVEDERARLAYLERRRRVEDVGRGEPVVEPAAGVPERLGDRVHEGGEVVLRALLDLGDTLGRRRHGTVAHLGRRLERHRADLRPGIERRQLDLEPAGELALLRPDELHGRSGVAGDHPTKSSEPAGYSSVVGRPGVPG